MTGHTYVFFGTLVLALLVFGGVADHALVEQQRVAEMAARAEVGQRAEQAARSVRATLAQLEQDVLNGRPWPGVAVSRRATPALRTPRPSAPGFLQRSEADLEALLSSTALSGSGLPEALVAAVALDRPEVRSQVGERLVAGFLPVDPEELPYLANALDLEDDARVRALQSRLQQAPPAAGLPATPDFRRALTRRGSVEGWARDDLGVSHYETPLDALLERAGVSDHAAVPDPSGLAEATVAVPDVEGLTLSVDPKVPGRLRVRGLRTLLWVAVLASIVGLAGLLRGLRREARAVEREKAFLTGVTHELRTPLAAIRLFGERLAHGRGDPKEYGSMVAQESERLESLVERVLALPHPDQKLSLSTLDPAELVRSAVSLAAAHAERRQITLTAYTPELPDARWDGEAVRQALQNLLDNAIQHGRQGGRVEVGAVDTDGLVKLSVSDDGPGIGKRDRKRIFWRFERGTTASSGTGLGLYLVDRVARAHGGRVDLVTEEGRGSTFTLVLPLEVLDTPSPSGNDGAPA